MQLSSQVMRKKLFYSTYKTPIAFFDLKPGSSANVLKPIPFGLCNPCTSPTTSPLIMSNTFSTSEIVGIKLHLLINTRCFSTNPARFPYGRGLSIGRSVIFRCSLATEEKPDTSTENCSSMLQILKKYGNLCPEITRSLWRSSTLRPGDFLEILSRIERCKNSDSTVKFLWILFNWAPRQRGNFQHLPISYEIMMSVLLRSKMLAEAESLFSCSSNTNGIFSNPSEQFSAIIQAYAENFQFQKAVSLYNRARNQGWELSCSCYQALLNHLIKIEKPDLVVKVYMDMIATKLGFCAEPLFLNIVVESLGKDNKTLEVVNILRQARTAGVVINHKALDTVVECFCSKKDYKDILNLIKEWAHIPSTSVGNKVVSSICKMLGSDYAWVFVQELKTLGFKLDDITFGILIVQSCKERKLRDAFIYLSESFYCGVKLNTLTYNALISGVIKEGMCKAASDIFHEMVDRDILVDLSTNKILLAGYCKYRKFDEIKNVLSLDSGEDPISKAFSVLGLDRLGFKVKRDNDGKFSKAEYFDCLGNGLYLETNNYDYESILEKVLVSAMTPDLDLELSNECQMGNFSGAIRVKNAAVQWGLELSTNTCSQFLKLMCASDFHVKETITLLHEKPDLWDQLDCNTLNLIVQSLSNNGFVVGARLVLDRLLKSGFPVDNASHNAMILGFYNEKNLQGMQDYFKLLEGITYLPFPKDINILVSCLCKLGLVEEMFIFYDRMTEEYHDLLPAFCAAIMKELSSARFTSTCTVFLEEVLNNIPMIDLLTEITSQKSYGPLIHCLMCSGRTKDALLLKQHILSRRRSHASFFYNIVLIESCKMGKLMEAIIHLNEMLANGLFPDYEILNAFVQVLCRQNYLKKAFEILGIMLRAHADLSILGYRSLVRLLCVNQLFFSAINLRKLIQIESVSKSLILQNILIFYLFQAKNSLLVDAVLDNTGETQSLGDTTTYNFFVYGYHKCGNMPKAVKTFYDMISYGMKPNNRSFRIIICYFCLNGELTKALELSTMMVSHRWKHDSFTQTSLAMGLISQGQISEAIYLLDQLEEQGLISECVHYDLLIKGLSEQGEVKKSVHLLNLMLKKGNLPSQESYNALILGFCNHKAFDEALDVNEEMFQKGLEPSEGSCNALICGLTECCRIDDARKILDSMLQVGIVPAFSMYNYVISCYLAENNMEKASEVHLDMQQAGYFPTFDTHWSLISNLSSSTRSKYKKGFLSSLLSADSIPAQRKKGRVFSSI